MNARQERNRRDAVGAVYAVCATACFGLAMWVGAPLFDVSESPSGPGVTPAVSSVPVSSYEGPFPSKPMPTCVMFCESQASSVPQVPESVAPQTHQVAGCVMFCDGDQRVPDFCSVACAGPGGMVPFSTGPMDACSVVCTGPAPVPFRTGPMNGCIVLCGNGDLRVPFDPRAGA